jgi:hypothetical protein
MRAPNGRNGGGRDRLFGTSGADLLVGDADVLRSATRASSRFVGG